MNVTRIGVAQNVAGIDSSQRRTEPPRRTTEGDRAPGGASGLEGTGASQEPTGGRTPVAVTTPTGPLKATVKLPDIPLRELSMTLDPDANRIVIKVIDSETKDVLRQIPAEETLQVLQELPGVRGLLLDKKG